MMKNDNLTSPPRQRTSVAIQGIDRSTPDDIVTDGKCEELHNLRWKDNAWRPVHPHREKVTLPALPVNYKVVYKHPVTEEHYYIVEALVNGTYYYYNFDSSVSYYTQGLTKIASFPTQQKVSHFGNVLMLSNEGSTHKYIYKRRTKSYKTYSSPLIPTLSITDTLGTDRSLPDYFRLSERVYRPELEGRYTAFLDNHWYASSRLGDALVAIKSWNSSHSDAAIAPTFSCLWLLTDVDTQTSMIPLTPNGASLDSGGTEWHGEIALFAAYHTADGKVVSPSAISICLSDNTLPNATFQQRDFFSEYSSEYAPLGDPNHRFVGCTVDVVYNADLTPADIRDRCPYSYILPQVKIDIDAHMDTDLITGVAIYCTRIYSIFDASSNLPNNGDIPTHKMWAQNKLPEQPFYLLKEFPLDADIDGDYVDSYSLSLDSNILQNAVTNKVYIPTNSHIINADNFVDYNNVLHLGAVHTEFNVSDILTKALISDDTGTQSTPYVSLNISDAEYFVKGNTMISGGLLSEPFSRILSYHDYRAKKFIVSWGDEESIFVLQPATANNIAYYIGPSDDYQKYPSFSASGGVMSDKPLSLPDASDTLYEPNRVQASEPNNPFSFPFENSYSFGSSNNRILAMQSAAIEMHEMKVGEMPLYVFTEEGIYALVAGSKTLYASVAAINYDKIINPNTLAINGAIVYITEKGVHLLTSAGTQVISTPIHDKNGMPPLDFLRECKIIWPKQYNEIVLLKEGNPKAYVYNLDSGYWSTRTLNGVKLNTDELYSKDTIYDLADENEVSALPISLATRPIKLGNVEFKRLETIIPRISTGDNIAIVDFNLTGSVDGTNYMPLRSWNGEIDLHKVNPLVFRRTPFSAKYFKLAINMDAETGESLTTSITHIDFEWYQRFRHRLR